MADSTTTAVSPLRRRMIDDMMLSNLSPATQRSYLHAVTKFSRYFGRSPDRLGLEDVRAFQVYLVSQGISWPSLNQTVCALRFFYGVTLNRGEIPERIAYAKPPFGSSEHVCPAYIAGLIGPGDRKSVQPMAARDGEFGYDQLHHFVADGVWESAPLETVLLKEADRLVGDVAGYLVIDDTALPKKGSHSVGVAAQYASSLGKTENLHSLRQKVNVRFPLSRSETCRSRNPNFAIQTRDVGTTQE